jgi:ATP-binding cassette subfamily B protein
MSERQEKKFEGLRREFRVMLQRARQVWRLVSARHKGGLAIAAVLMALTSAVNTVMPLLLGNLVDAAQRGLHQGIGSDALYRLAAVYLGLLGGAYLLREALNVGRRYLVENTCTRIDRDMTIRVVSHLLKMDLSQFTQEKIGTLHGRIGRSVDGFVRFLRLGFLTFFPALLTGVFALATTLGKQPWLGLAMAGVIPCSIALTLWQLVSQQGVRLKLLRSREEMDGTVVEQLSGIDYVRAAHTHRYEVARVARAAERRRAKEVRYHFRMSLFGCAKALNEGLFHILVLSFAIHLAVTGAISIGDILTFSILFLNVMTPLSEIHRVIDEGHESSLLVGDLVKILAEPVDRSFETPVGKVPRLTAEEKIVVFQDLQVDYRTADGKPSRALNDFGLVIRHGETVGIAGRSGCGKSTWLKVLLRLTHPSGGKAYLGGVPLEAISREAIGKFIGYVGQSPFVFAGTIAENIAYGTENPTLEEITQAAQKAHIHDEIMALPSGYQALVSERGQNLSGGQKQRLALARLFLKNPPILILDEGTSALDNISERHVQRALAAARADRTVILVAHRLSTLRDADRILVLDKGRIVETGSYAELLQRGGVFTELVMSAERDGVFPEKWRLPPDSSLTAPRAPEGMVEVATPGPVAPQASPVCDPVPA